jgi:hypothetical protein
MIRLTNEKVIIHSDNANLPKIGDTPVVVLKNSTFTAWESDSQGMAYKRLLMSEMHNLPF